MEETRNMIIGHGDIASALVDLPRGKAGRKGWVFFASGLSNSGEKRESEYQREEDLLMKQNKRKHIVYFSSLCVFYSDNRYAMHKKHMEILIKKNFKHYTIVRMGNITWGKNPHTLINFLRNRYIQGEPLEIQDTYRYIVDKDEFLHWIEMIPEWSCEMNLTGKRLKVAEIVKEYCQPKLTIKNFMNTPNITKIPNTDRTKLAEMFGKLGFKYGAEVGVRRGAYSELLCQTIPGLKLLCIDPWLKYKTVPRPPSQERQDENYNITKEKLAPYDATLIRKMSMDAVKDVPDEALDFVYIDGHHDYEFVLEDITEWSKKVKKDGIVAGDDYTEEAQGVKQAVNEYMFENNITLFLMGNRFWYFIKA